MNKIIWFFPLCLLIATLIFNEVLIYYLKIGVTCKWPEVKDDINSLNVFMISDTHLLGVNRGHWFDKIKREWQMKRAFHSAVSLLSPSAAFFLGDLLDEGKWSNEELFKNYSEQFKKLFETYIPIHVLAGNHDLGFHYEMHPHGVHWFQQNFNRSLVDYVTIAGHHFVFINSMAFHGDECYLCKNAQVELEAISQALNCSKHNSCKDRNHFIPYRRPIVLLHYPLFRMNESDCLRDEEFDYDAPNRDEVYKERRESLSIEATKQLINTLEPRAVFNGHSHRDCKKRWIRPIYFWEHTVNSFSWRNGDRPTFLMVRITDTEVNVRTCFLPNESTTIIIYVVSIIIIIIWLPSILYSPIRGRFMKRGPSFTFLSDLKDSKYD